MKIRLASLEDIPEIVSVLRESLGEIKLPKSAEIWRYKHFDNPFGASLVLVAVHDDRIVGVRAFMRWNWDKGNNNYSCLRAVDTATLPEFRGRGIFKKLTLKAVEMAAERGDHLVFNTPNSQSMPGYLKMGWERIDKLSVQLIPCNPFHWKRSENFEYDIQRNCSSFQLQDLITTYNKMQQEKGKMFTPKSLAYLNWRYYNNPLQNYQIREESDYFISGYVKKHKYLKELRITEALFYNEESIENLWSGIKDWGRHFGVQIISIANTSLNNSNIFVLRGKFGPDLTLRNLNLEENVRKDIFRISNWHYTLGDLELF